MGVAGLQYALDLKAPKDIPAFIKNVSGIFKRMVVLGNVDNTSDKDKPKSDATLGMVTTSARAFDLRMLNEQTN